MPPQTPGQPFRCLFRVAGPRDGVRFRLRPGSYIRDMSCAELAPDQRRTLKDLAAGKVPNDHGTLEEFRRRGWVMPDSDELTEVGWARARDSSDTRSSLSGARL